MERLYSLYSMDTLTGLKMGISLSSFKASQAEVEQGKSHFFTALFQMATLYNVMAIFSSRILPHITHPQYQRIASTSCSILWYANITLIPYSIAVKAERVKSHKYLEKPFSFVARHLNKMVNTALLACLISLPMIGSGPFAFGVAIPLIYHQLESSHFISPSNVQKTTLKYLYILSDIRTIAKDKLTSKAIAFLSLLSHSEELAKKLLKYTAGAKLWYEMNAPCEVKDLSFQEMMDILNTSDPSPDNYRINPAHCNKEFSQDLPQDKNFDQFLELEKTIDWKTLHSSLRGKFKEDERFLEEVLKLKFPDVTLEALKENFDSYVQQSASELNLTEAEFFAKQASHQLHQFVAVLKKEVAAQGVIEDLEDAMTSSSQILAYLGTCQDMTEKEDILMKLAVEAGEYCPAGLKRATNEIVMGMQSQSPNQDPDKDFEFQMNQELQRIRKEMCERYYLGGADSLVKLTKVPHALFTLVKGYFQSNQTDGQNARQTIDAQLIEPQTLTVAGDVHFKEFFDKHTALLGFYPLTAAERAAIDPADFMLKFTLNIFLRKNRELMEAIYKLRLNEAFLKAGLVNLAPYLIRKIRASKTLSEKEKETFIERMWDFSKPTNTPLLYFVMQGVLIKK